MKMRKKSNSGQGLIEYALLAALIALVSVAILTGMGSTINSGLYGSISGNLTTVEGNIKNSP